MRIPNIAMPVAPSEPATHTYWRAGYCAGHQAGAEAILDFLFHEWSTVLASNLAMGAALCNAHYTAIEEAEEHRLYHQFGYRSVMCWSPGCGRESP